MPRLSYHPDVPHFAYDSEWSESDDIKQEDVKNEHSEQKSVKQEHQEAQPIRRQRPAVYQGYDWDDAARIANQKARSEGIAELPVTQVGRVMQEGKITSLFNLNNYGARDFIAYDGLDVLARVQDSALINIVIYELASLHIGKKTQTGHPSDLDLVVKTEMMKTDGIFSGWAVHIRPEVVPRNKRKPDDNQQQTRLQRRRVQN